MIPRRTFLLAALVVACSKKSDGRCAFCGMKIDPASPWRADLTDGSAQVVGRYDSPKCALLAWRTGKIPPASAMRAQDYYDRAWHDARELRFVLGSDVVGPMGNDAVPVDAARAQKFATDHHGTRTVTLDELTRETLESL